MSEAAERTFSLGRLGVELPHELQAGEDERRERVPQPLRPALAKVSASRQQHAVLALAVGASQVVHQSGHQVLLLLKVLLVNVLRVNRISVAYERESAQARKRQ
jgi:hypothetical protein